MPSNVLSKTQVAQTGAYSADMSFYQAPLIGPRAPIRGDFENIGLYIEGTQSADVLFGTQGNDGIYGLGGNDRLYGGGGNDLIDGGDGADVLYGESGHDTLYGGGALDTLYGGAGNDKLYGGDWIDYLEGGAGADLLDGGDGNDTVTYEHSTLGVTLDMATGGVTNDAAGDTYVSIEFLYGSNLSDILSGDAANNTIGGLGGDDFIFGQGGHDNIWGADGNDTLRGGDGGDTLYGGNGDDLLVGGQDNWQNTFYFGLNDTGTDRVFDFQQELDKIGFVGVWAPSLLGNDRALAHGQIVGGTLAHDNLDSSDRIFWNDATHQLIKLDMTQSGLTGRVTHGQVLATFAADVTIFTTDFV
jgi:Ca2+-binding RTX toxin-like protein